MRYGEEGDSSATCAITELGKWRAIFDNHAPDNGEATKTTSFTEVSSGFVLRS